jgi:hypothetical protein
MSFLFKVVLKRYNNYIKNYLETVWQSSVKKPSVVGHTELTQNWNRFSSTPKKTATTNAATLATTAPTFPTWIRDQFFHFFNLSNIFLKKMFF